MGSSSHFCVRVIYFNDAVKSLLKCVYRCPCILYMTFYIKHIFIQAVYYCFTPRHLV